MRMPDDESPELKARRSIRGKQDPTPPPHDEHGPLPSCKDLDRLQWTTLLYDMHESNPDNGLVRDKTDGRAPSSIAATGLALANLPIIVERDIVCRPFAAKSARRVLRFLCELPQGTQP